MHTEIMPRAEARLDELDEKPDFIGWLLSNVLKLGPPAFRLIRHNDLIFLRHIGGWVFVIRLDETRDTIRLLDIVHFDD